MSSTLALALLISAHGQAAIPPTPPRLRGGTILASDYPAAARAARAEGATRIALQIGTNGRVTECLVTGSSGHSELDSASCALAQERYLFTPGTRNGQPVTSRYAQTIRWALPPAPAAASTGNPAEGAAPSAPQ